MENDLMQVVEYVIHWQNEVNKARFKKVNRKRNLEQSDLDKIGSVGKFITK